MKSNPAWADSPAFPCPDKEISAGLSKREYFAVMALQGIMASLKPLPHDPGQMAVIMADQLIEALNKNGKS